MTIITETRWKCDYCRNVSPVFDLSGAISISWQPPGWLRMFVQDEKHYRSYRHFCCKQHQELYVKEREYASH